MPHLSLATTSTRFVRAPAAQWVHDIRNALAVAQLHLETLERQAGPNGSKAASAAYAVMLRAASMCDASLAENDTRHDQGAKRRGFDLMRTIAEIVAVLTPALPPGFDIRTPREAVCMVLADPGDIYRIVFNLVQNAIAVARKGGRVTYVGIDLSRNNSSVVVRIFDDGPGLPRSIRLNAFRRKASLTSGNHGWGLTIARELAERNGSTLRLATVAKGTCYVLELAGMHALPRALGRV